MNRNRKYHAAWIAALLLAGPATAAQQPQAAQQLSLQISAQPMREALAALAAQTGVQLIFPADVAEDLAAPAINGNYTVRDALDVLLANSGLRQDWINARTVAIRVKEIGTQPPDAAATSKGVQRSTASAQRMARVEFSDDQSTWVTADIPNSRPSLDEHRVIDSKGIPEMLVEGVRTSNTDIRRTEDDVQPYVVFKADDIERAMAPDLGTFLRTHLPMNQARGSEAQNLASSRGNQSRVDLRGLGADQTLILVNGRRMPGVSDGEDFGQPDINGIPLSAVERIEILPSTAGGIYGGGATGGVLNIILKRNYSNLDLTARYDGTFAGGGVRRRLDAVGGFALEGGRTSVMVMASYQDGNPLYTGDRNLAARARNLQDANDPDAYTASTYPVHGYTTNIKSVSGRNLVLVDGMQSLGWPTASVPLGYAGPASDEGAAFLGTSGHYNTDFAEDPAGLQYSLVAAPTVRSAAVNLRREFTDRIEAFLDVSRYDNRAVKVGSGTVASATNVVLPVGPNNPFTEAVRLAIPIPGYDARRLLTRSGSETEQISGGLIVRLPREWTLQGEYSWSRSTFTYDYRAAFLTQDGLAALLDGRLDPLSDVNAYPMDFSAYYPDEAGQRSGAVLKYPTLHKDATLRVAGPLLHLPGGPLRLAAVLENREQYASDQLRTDYNPGLDPDYTYYAAGGTTTRSVYAELTAPMVSAGNARPGLRGLDLQASYRYDGTHIRTRPFDDIFVPVPSADGPFFDTPFQTSDVSGNQYTLGLRYTPAGSLAFRLSFGEGILPPAPVQLSEALLPVEFVNFSGLIDSKRGDTFVTDETVERFSIIGSLLLRSERSQSWSAGIIVTPDILPGLRLSVDYTRIEKTDEVTTLSDQSYLDLEDSFPGYIVRDPLTPADQALGYTGGVIRELNFGYVNLAYSLLEAYDIQADYNWSTRFGEFAANVVATWQPHFEQQATPESDVVDQVGYSNGPLKLRANAGLRWSRGALSLGWNMQYYDASRVYSTTASTSRRNATVRGQGSEWISTQTYHDVFGRYRFERSPSFAHGLLQNTELLISVQNVFNHSPPILASASSYFVAGYSTEGDPRLRRYSIAITKRFGR